MVSFTKPSKFGLFQLLVVCALVAFFISFGEAGGPMLMIKGGHGGSGGGNAASILAAGLVIRLLSNLHKHNHHVGGRGYSMGDEHGYQMGRFNVGHSFASHDAHLRDYGYEPQGFAWAK